MSNFTLLGSGGHAASDQTYTDGNYYSNVGLGRCAMILSPFTSEANVQQTIRVPGAISYLTWGMNTGFPVTLTFTLRQNASNTALSISIPAMTTGFITDSSGTASVSNGDTLDFAAYVPAPPGGVAYTGDFYCASARFGTTSSTIASAQLLAAVGPSTIVPSQSTPKFVSFFGILGSGDDADPTESNQQFEFLAASNTWRNMACYVESNGFTSDTFVHNRINGRNGSMAITIRAGYSGYFEDVADSDSVGFGDLLDYGITSRADGQNNLRVDWIGAHLLGNETAECMIGGTPTDYPPLGLIVSGQTRFSSLFGAGNTQPETARATGSVPYALSASGYANHITAVSDNTSTATFTLLKNGVASSLAVSSLAGQTGFFVVSSVDNTDFRVGDTCTNQIVGKGPAGTSVTWAGSAVLLTPSSS